jgi:hypothetical protein
MEHLVAEQLRMRIPIIIFFHTLFYLGDESHVANLEIILEQMHLLRTSGLENAAAEIHVGVNGGEESEFFAKSLLPPKANIVYHGLQCRSENRTLLMIEQWCRANQGEAHILYAHSKGISHAKGSDYGENMSRPWRNRMMETCVWNWRQCVQDLLSHEACGCHWLTGQGWDKSQHYFAGTTYWARASFLRTLPSMMLRERIKTSGLESPESRYEAEVWIGNGPRLPVVKNYYDGGIGT